MRYVIMIKFSFQQQITELFRLFLEEAGDGCVMLLYYQNKKIKQNTVLKHTSIRPVIWQVKKDYSIRWL